MPSPPVRAPSVRPSVFNTCGTRLDVHPGMARHAPAVAQSALAALRSMRLPCAVLSSGAGGMLQEGLRARRVGRGLRTVLSVDAASVCKPDHRVDCLATARPGPLG